MSFDIKNDTLRIIVPVGTIPGREIPLFENATALAKEAFEAAGFEKVVLVEKPAAFFTRAYSDSGCGWAALYNYGLVLRSSFTPYVTLEELQKHAAIINVWHDIFSHKIPTDTLIKFSPTLTMAAVNALANK